MRDQSVPRFDEDGDEVERDYGPNDLAHLRRINPEKYRQVVQSNLDEGDTVEAWEKRNLERAREALRRQGL